MPNLQNESFDDRTVPTRSKDMIDHFLDTYGVLERAHDRLCGSIRPGEADWEKFQTLRSAIAAYDKAVTAFMKSTLFLVNAEHGPRRLDADR